MLLLLSHATSSYTLSSSTPSLSSTRAAAASSPLRAAPPRAQEDAAGPSPEAWREFRQQLISGGLKLTTDDDAPSADADGAASTAATAAATTGPSKPERQAVAPKNEALLKTQSAALYDEYINGGWAHASPVEAGALLCRLPMPATFIQKMRDGSSDVWPTKLRERMRAELPEATDEMDADALFAKWSANTNYAYKLAEATIAASVRSIGARAQGGRIDPRELSGEERELLELYGESQEAWQQVCLVLSASGEGAARESVVLNRPLAKAIDYSLAQLLVSGEEAGDNLEGRADTVANKLTMAFGREAAVYWGGPEKQRTGGLLVHGVAGLAGSVEVAPGMRIYTCAGLDVEAAADAVLAGKCSPLDFRWFIGRHATLRTSGAEWVSIACARPIALKQCLGLPKPLWHEVMELCGGECAALSRIELLKRDDLVGDLDNDDELSRAELRKRADGDEGGEGPVN